MERKIQAFKEIYNDLKDDCESFDLGKETKAKDIAGRIRTLLKDGKSSVSMLTHIGKKEIKYWDSAIPYDISPSFSYFDIDGEFSNNIISVSRVYMGLVYKKMHGNKGIATFSCAPLYQRKSLKPQVLLKPFAEWWDQIIYEDPYSDLRLSRRTLILSCAEKDGFAHFDSNLNPEYKKLLQSDSLELSINGQKIEFIINPAKNSIRQIGYEVAETIKDQLNDILSSGN